MNPGLSASSCLFACPYRTFLGILPLGFLEAAYEVRGTHKWKNPIFFFFLAGGGGIFYPKLPKMAQICQNQGFVITVWRKQCEMRDFTIIILVHNLGQNPLFIHHYLWKDIVGILDFLPGDTHNRKLATEIITFDF